MVMVNHAAYPDTPGKDTARQRFAFWITTVLRKRIGYRGIIFSDDLEMGGILKFMPIEEAAIAAVRAGMDLLEICHSPELILRAYESLIAEAERSAAFRNLLLARRNVARKRKQIVGGKLSGPPRQNNSRFFASGSCGSMRSSNRNPQAGHAASLKWR